MSGKVMVFVFFIYGLAFFVLGLAILIYPKKGSAFRLANHLWLIAGFGLTHGINEWLDMFIMIQTPGAPEVLKVLRMITLPISFLFLLRFGTRVIVESRRKYRLLEFFPLVLFGIWVGIFVLSEQHFLMGDIWSRYLLCAPGTFLTAAAMLMQTPQFEETKMRSVVKNLRFVAITFACYGVLAGLIVKKADFFGANFLNYDMFRDTFGVPVQIFRAVCAMAIAVSTTYVLSIFRWESKEALRRSEERLGTITATAPVVLFVQDRNCIVRYIQGKGLDLLGLKPAEVVGRRFSEVFPAVAQFEQDSRRALSGEEFAASITLGSAVFECCYSPVVDNDGEISGVIGAALDVTGKVRAQEQLDRYRQRLEKNARLAEIGTLSSAMANEINEPLAVTRLLLRRLISNITNDSVDATAIDSLHKSLSEVSKAADLVDRFCNMTQLYGATVTSPVDIYQIAKRVMGAFAETAKRVNLSIAIKDLNLVPFMVITVRELEQVFFILIQYVIHASNAGEHDKLTIGCRHSEKAIELIFAGTCGGMEPDKMEHIFDPFFVPESGAKDTGLSLAVAKRIITNHGGQISVESTSGHGVTFSVTLPAEQMY